MAVKRKPGVKVKKVVSSPDGRSIVLAMEYDRFKRKDMDEIINMQTQAAMTRSIANWLDCGEKNVWIFL